MAGNWFTEIDLERGARRLAAVAGAASGTLLLGGMGVGYFVAHVLTQPRAPSPDDVYVMTPFETGVDYEDVTFPAGDHTIQGWWFPRPETTRVTICCTGYRGSKSEMIGIGTALWRAGFNVLLFDYYGHGADRGQPVTLAYRELGDFNAAVDYVLARMPQARLGVIGFSMGAAIAIMGSVHRPEVRVVVADSPFATHTDVVVHNVERVIHVSAQPFARFIDFFLDRLAGYTSSDVNPLRDVAALSPRPLLLFHGTADTIIPVSHAHQLYEAAGEPKQLVLAEGAGHCGAYFQDRPAYCRRVVEFFVAALHEDTVTDEPAVRVERATHDEPLLEASETTAERSSREG